MTEVMRSSGLGRLQQEPGREARALLAEAEQRSERILAWLRLAVLVLLVLVERVFELIGNHHVFAVSFSLYGAATVAALVLAYRRAHQPWLGWALTTLDAVLVLHFAATLVFAGGWSTADAISAPGVVMIFLVLAQAAVRYRPALVAYAAGLFLGGWVLLHVAADPSLSDHFRHWRGDEAAFAAIVATTALALFAAAERARRLLASAILESQLRAALSRFVPAKLVEELERDSGTIFGRAPSATHNVAVLFIDIRGFTALAEELPPAATLDLLNEYRGRVTAPIVENGGIVDKFIGDAVMAVFGVPRAHGTDAANAIRCAVAILGRVSEWNDERARDSKQTIKVGVGGHYGEAIVGVVGADERLEYTVIGDTVNLAQRAERVAARRNASILVTRELLDAARIADPESVGDRTWIELQPIKVAGRRQPASFFASRSRSDAGVVDRKAAEACLVSDDEVAAIR